MELGEQVSACLSLTITSKDKGPNILPRENSSMITWCMASYLISNFICLVHSEGNLSSSEVNHVQRCWENTSFQRWEGGVLNEQSSSFLQKLMLICSTSHPGQHSTSFPRPTWLEEPMPSLELGFHRIFFEKPTAHFKMFYSLKTATILPLFPLPWPEHSGLTRLSFRGLVAILWFGFFPPAWPAFRIFTFSLNSGKPLQSSGETLFPITQREVGFACS